MTSPGDVVYLGTLLTNLHFWGVVSDLETPSMMTGTFEIAGTDGAVTIDALVGPRGDPGEPSPIVKMQYGVNYNDPAQLPTNLLNNANDIGKAYWIGNQVWMWTGTTWYQKQMGVPGPPGPTPHIHPSAELVPSGLPTSLTQPIEVKPSGTALDPGMLFRFDQDSITGPPGPSGPIRAAVDYDNSVAPQTGQAIVWNQTKGKFNPGAFDLLSVRCYSMPEGSFQAYSGFMAGGPALIGSFAVPPQPFDWKPFVLGHINAIGAEFSLTNPLTIGCEVTLGDPIAGQLVGRGFGTFLNYAFIVPHFSRPGDTRTAVTPDNSVARVPAYHTGKQGTLYVSLYNDGVPGAANFQPQNAQLLVMVVPTSSYVTPANSLFDGDLIAQATFMGVLNQGQHLGGTLSATATLTGALA